MVYADVTLNVARIEVRDRGDGRWPYFVCGVVVILHRVLRLCSMSQNLVCAEDDADMVHVERQP